MQSSTRIIVHGSHITENLQHHKTADVRRILEDKGFSENGDSAADGEIHFHPPAGTPDDGKQTTIELEDDFVAENGVTHSGQ